MKSIRVDIRDASGGCSMTGITVTFEDSETDFESAKAKALGHIVHELSRYGLSEALGGIGIRKDDTLFINGQKYGPVR